MTDQTPIPCTCGHATPILDAHDKTNAVALECDRCGRCVCGYGKEEALRMWNAAMSAFPPSRNQRTV